MDSQTQNDLIGLQKGVVRLAAHRAEWASLFEAEKAHIIRVIDNCARVLDCQQIGSTAIPGIAAKPIIDIGMALECFADGFALVEPLERIGYEYKGENGVPGRHYFQYGDPCTFHLHVFAQNSPGWRNHLLFRDYLCANPQAAAEYERLKLELAEKYPADREKYTDGKTAFVQAILERARREQGE
jgi:GrpB-like predicted nucleotidyltransferase (UPF0157 family)